MLHYANAYIGSDGHINCQPKNKDRRHTIRMGN